MENFQLKYQVTVKLEYDLLWTPVEGDGYIVCKKFSSSTIVFCI